MDKYKLEEEIDTLEYVLDIFDSVIHHLKDLSSEEYNYIIFQMQDLFNDLDYIFSEKQTSFDAYNKQQLLESRLERYERELEYRKMQGF